MGLIWAWKDCRNRGEWNSIRTTIEELARGLVERESRYVRDKAGKQDPEEKKSSERRSDQSKDKRMEECWELSKGLSLCIRRLSWISRSKELSLSESMEILSEDAVCPVLQICSLMEEGP